MTNIFIMALGALALLGLPLFALIGGLALVLFNSIGQDAGLVMGDTYKIAITPGLMALPLFVFTGYLLAETKISNRILRFFTSIMGWLPGGTVISLMIATAIFTAFTGISIVTIVAFGGILLPVLRDLKYPDKFSYGFASSIGPLGILLPPCIVVVLYGIVAQVSIQGLYIAGILPVLVCFVILSVYVGLFSIKNDISKQRFSLKELCFSFWEIKYEAPITIIILVGIFGGFLTINDAAAVTVVYFLFVEVCILKEVNINRIPRIMENSMVMLGAIFFIVGVAMSFANFLVFQEIPMQLLAWIKVTINSKLSFLIILNLFLFVVGMALDMFTAILIIVPMILPIANYFDINPYHLGIIFLFNLELGFMTPPVGINLFVSAMRFDKSVLEIFKSVIPFLLLLILCLAILTYFPGISTFLVDYFNIKGQISIQ